MIHHNLPGEGSTTEWFARLNKFEQQETRRQVKFKRQQWPGIEDGPHSKYPDHTYPHILPADELGKAFYPPIAQAVSDYCHEGDIAIHSESLNLRSSQVCCFNVMFPLRQDLALAAVALGPALPGVRTVSHIEFEYTGPAGTTAWLGEPSQGRRGQNRTSIDVAIWWEDGQRRYLTLGEWKYTERNYGTCGGYASKGNKNAGHCRAASYPICCQNCYLTNTRNHRRYWEHLAEAGIDPGQLAQVRGCPFRGPFYQLWRQYLLAAYRRQTQPPDEPQADEVNVLLLGFRGNASLTQRPPELGVLGATVIEAWNTILGGVPPLRHVAVEDMIDVVRRDGWADGHDWLAYLHSRYGL